MSERPDLRKLIHHDAGNGVPAALGPRLQPPLAEWGADVAGNTQFLCKPPWVSLALGGAILLSVMSINLIGDALVDWLNPRTPRCACARGKAEKGGAGKRAEGARRGEKITRRQSDQR
jgi:hypothetical protein